MSLGTQKLGHHLSSRCHIHDIRCLLEGVDIRAREAAFEFFLGDSDGTGKLKLISRNVLCVSLDIRNILVPSRRQPFSEGQLRVKRLVRYPQYRWHNGRFTHEPSVLIICPFVDLMFLFLDPVQRGMLGLDLSFAEHTSCVAVIWAERFRVGAISSSTTARGSVTAQIRFGVVCSLAEDRRGHAGMDEFVRARGCEVAIQSVSYMNCC